MSTKANQLLQKAGSFMFAAREALAVVAAEYEVATAEAMRNSPFAVETDSLYETWKATSRLLLETGTIERCLKEVYERAPTSGDSGKLRAVSLLSSNVAQARPTDVQMKGPKNKATLTPIKRAKVKDKPDTPPVDIEHTPPEANGPGEDAAVKVKPVRTVITKNAAKVLEHLKATMPVGKMTRLTQVTVANEAGLPQGSITASLGVLTTMGYLKEGKKGFYRLSAKV